MWSRGGPLPRTMWSGWANEGAVWRRPPVELKKAEHRGLMERGGGGGDPKREGGREEMREEGLNSG